MLVLQRETMVRNIETYAAAPGPGSPFRQDETAWKAAPHRQGAHRRRLWLDTREAARLLVVNVVDHLNATAHLLASPTIFLWAPSTVVRVACEAAAKIAYLFDPEMSYELRITRGAALLLHSAQEKIKAAANVTRVVADAEERATHVRDTLLNRITDAGISVPSSSGKPLISPSGEKVARTLRLSALVAEHFPHRPSLYQQASAVVHSIPWTLTSAIASDHTESYLRLEPDMLELGATALAGLDAAHLVTTAHARYWGYDYQRPEVDWQRRTRAVDELMKAWWFDHAAGRRSQ